MGTKKKYRQLNALVAQAIKGDKKSFEKLCELEAPQVIYFCTKLMGNVHDGEDAAQEVFIYMQKKISSLITPEAYTSWIQKMTYNVCRRMRRNKMNTSNTVPIEELAEKKGILP